VVLLAGALLLNASSTRRCSFFNASNPSSSSLCHGYRTKTWKPSADDATRKLVIEIARVTNIVGYGWCSSWLSVRYANALGSAVFKGPRLSGIEIIVVLQGGLHIRSARGLLVIK